MWSTTIIHTQKDTAQRSRLSRRCTTRSLKSDLTLVSNLLGPGFLMRTSGLNASRLAHWSQNSGGFNFHPGAVSSSTLVLMGPHRETHKQPNTLTHSCKQFGVTTHSLATGGRSCRGEYLQRSSNMGIQPWISLHSTKFSSSLPAAENSLHSDFGWCCCWWQGD